MADRRDRPSDELLAELIQALVAAPDLLDPEGAPPLPREDLVQAIEALEQGLRKTHRMAQSLARLEASIRTPSERLRLALLRHRVRELLRTWRRWLDEPEHASRA